MSLTCDMDFDGDAAWYYTQPDDFIALDTKRGRKCCSCGEHIKVGALVLRYWCNRPPKNEIEVRIHGDDYEAVSMPTRYMCESCGDLALNLKELGYCTPPGDDMRKLVKEYREQQQFDADYKRGWAAGTAGLPLPDDASEGFKSGHRSGAWSRPKEVV